MARISRGNAQTVFDKYKGILYKPTAEGGTVCIDKWNIEWNWDKNGNLPSKAGVVSWIGERCEEFGKDHHTGAKSPKRAVTASIREPTAERLRSIDFWAPYDIGTLSAVVAVLQAEIVDRPKVAKRKELAEIVRGLESNGVEIPKKLQELIEENRQTML